jgi:hypothetical protein
LITEEDIKAFAEELEAFRKPKPTVAQMVDEFAVTMKQPKDREMAEVLVVEEYQEWCMAGGDEYGSGYGLGGKYSPAEELKELADLVYVCYGYARVMGWDLDEAIRRVHKNNLTRCVWPDGSVKYREDGKVLKNPDAPKIDLTDLV